MQTLLQQGVITKSQVLWFNFSNNLKGKSRSMFIETCPVRFIVLVLVPTCAARGVGLAGRTVHETGMDVFSCQIPHIFPISNSITILKLVSLSCPSLPGLGFRASTCKVLCPPCSTHDQWTLFIFN